MEQRPTEPGARRNELPVDESSEQPTPQSPQHETSITAEETRGASAQVEDRDVIADEAETIGRHDSDRAVTDGDFYGGTCRALTSRGVTGAHDPVCERAGLSA